jgi:formylglycine-generating enzyme required for sulfatase activity
VGVPRGGVRAAAPHDMIRNVFEWTSSEWSPGSGTYVWRGGSFVDNRRNARSSCRYNYRPVVQDPVLGFRVAAGT